MQATPEARRHLDKLPAKVHSAVLAAIFDTIAVNPHRAGTRLRGEFEGLRSARRGDYRVIYEILEDERVVLVHRAAHRADVYRRA